MSAFELPEGFLCDEAIRPHLEKVMAGEYDVPIRADRRLTVLDIGANAGAFALWAAKKWPGCLVYAYEPHPVTFDLLQRNASFAPQQIVPIEAGIGVGSGYRQLFEGANNSGEATIFPGNECSSGTSRLVEIRHPNTLPHADILKIDAEGVEPEIIEELLRDGREFIAVMFEYHRLDDRRRIDRMLNDYVLTGAHVGCPGIGTMRYVHRKYMGRHL